ncbi:MAG: hypothetical protein KC468_09470 [Myxococcales bacterium]|nr:hypothetical protein [Myxococcales bacterium]
MLHAALLSLLLALAAAPARDAPTRCADDAAALRRGLGGDVAPQQLLTSARRLVAAERRASEDPARALAERRRCAQQTEQLVRALAYQLHRELTVAGRGAPSEREFQRGLDVYDLWLRRFGLSGPRVYDMHYFRAELLWAWAVWARASGRPASGWRQRFGDAADAFARVLELNPEGRYTLDAAWAHVLATAEHVDHRPPPWCPVCGYEVCFYRAVPSRGRPYPDVALGWRGSRTPTQTVEDAKGRAPE